MRALNGVNGTISMLASMGGLYHWDLGFYYWDSQSKKTMGKWGWDLDMNKTIEMGFGQNLD